MHFWWAKGEKRITPELIRAFIGDLERLRVAVDGRATASVVFDTTHSLCRKYGLTAYDAAYLEIATRESCPLATADQDLRMAAIAEGVDAL